MTKLTRQWLVSKNACSKGVEWFEEQKETDVVKVLKKLAKESHYEWANWLIARKMKYKQYVSYAVFAAEQVIDIFEKKYPDDKNPRNAIEAAKKCINNPNKKNKAAAVAAAVAAADAAVAAAAAAYAADAAAAAAATVADAKREKLQEKILNCGIKLLEQI